MCPLSPKFQFYFKKGSSKEPILYVMSPKTTKKRIWSVKGYCTLGKYVTKTLYKSNWADDNKGPQL